MGPEQTYALDAAKHIRITRWLRPAVAASVSSCVAVAMAASPVQADDGDFRSQSARPDTLVTGVVTRDGRTLAGADIMAVAWPNQETLEALADGDPVDTDVVARTSSDQNGRFAIRLDPGAVDPVYTGRAGQIDIELVIADAEKEVVWHFSATRPTPDLASSSIAWSNPRLGLPDLADRLTDQWGPTQVSIDLGRTPSVVEVGDEPARWIDDDNRPLGLTSAADEASRVPVQPRRAQFDHDGPDDANIAAELWCATSTYRNNITETFVHAVGTLQGRPYVVQTTSSSHSMGVAYKAGSGKWSQSGTLTRTTGASADNHLGMSKRVHNRVNYRLYAGCETTSDQWRPHSFNSLNDYSVTVSRPNWTHCSNTIYRNGTASKENGSNVTYSSGVDFPNISLSSKSTFSKNTKVRWEFSGTGARLCGSSSLGWSEAPQAGAYVP